MKYATSNFAMACSLSRSDLASIVQPGVAARGNHASTTGRLPRY